MLSTRFTGSSTSITVVSLRSAASTAVCAPGAAEPVGDERRRRVMVDQPVGVSSTLRIADQRRSKNTLEYASTASSRPTAASGGYQS